MKRLLGLILVRLRFGDAALSRNVYVVQGQRRGGTVIRSRSATAGFVVAALAAPLLAALLVCVLAAGASAGTKTETIVLSGWPESAPATATLKQVIASFEPSHPGIDVEYRPLVNYPSDIEASFAAGAPPDVFYVDSSVAPDWIARGYLLPLHGFVTKRGFDTSHFFPILREAFEGPGGQPYGFPKDWSPLALWTNSALVPAAPATWTELRTTAEQVKAATGITPICLPVDWARLLAFVEQNGASLGMIDSPAANAAVQFYVGLVRDGLAATPDALNEPWCGQALADGVTAIAFEGNWLLPVMQQSSVQYSIHPLPSNVRRGNLAFTAAYGIASSSQHKQAAWALLSYLTGRAGMQQWVNGAVAQPSRDDVAPLPGTEVFQGEAPISTVWQFGTGFSDLMGHANTDLGKVFGGTESIDQMLANMQTALSG
jgi:multiple sugar transport system substrate-binding protein